MEAFDQGNNTYHKILFSESYFEADGNTETNYYTVNVDNEFNLDWSTFKWFESKDELKSIEEQFNLDLDQDGEISSTNQLSNTLQDVGTDTAGKSASTQKEGYGSRTVTTHLQLHTQTAPFFPTITITKPMTSQSQARL